MKRLAVFFMSVFFCIGRVFAYDSPGHKAIESQAYCFFSQMQATSEHPDGATMLSYLQQIGVFADNYPAPHSSYPDFSLERQFAQDKQMYHFMASNGAVRRAARLSGVAAIEQHALLMHSLPDCLQMMYFFFQETMLNPKGASQAGRGLYVLIHVVEDSYSPEHTTRDSVTGDLVTIKGWNLSSLFWPPGAKYREPRKHLMRLLHNSRHPDGDASWKGDKPGGLSPQATLAAHAVADLLKTLYETCNAANSDDQFIASYFATYFRPFGSELQAAIFTFPGTADQITFDFSVLFNTKSGNNTAFAYDRFPKYVLMGTGTTSFSKQVTGAYGISFEQFVTPGAADNLHSMLLRMPYAFGGSLTAINNSSATFKNNLNIKGFAKTVLSLPLLPTDLEPFFGAGLFPLAGSRHFGALYGIDGAFNLGNDWGIDKITTSLRIAIGFEHDFSGIPAKNSLTLKIGINSWQGRVIKTD